jgi:hypothetical protein
MGLYSRVCAYLCWPSRIQSKIIFFTRGEATTNMYVPRDKYIYRPVWKNPAERQAVYLACLAGAPQETYKYIDTESSKIFRAFTNNVFSPRVIHMNDIRNPEYLFRMIELNYSTYGRLYIQFPWCLDDKYLKRELITGFFQALCGRPDLLGLVAQKYPDEYARHADKSTILLEPVRQAIISICSPGNTDTPRRISMELLCSSAARDWPEMCELILSLWPRYEYWPCTNATNNLLLDRRRLGYTFMAVALMSRGSNQCYKLGQEYGMRISSRAINRSLRCRSQVEQKN